MGLVERVTRYLFVSHSPERADVLLVPGGPFAEPAERAAQLYRAGYAPLVALSGNCWIFHRSGGPSECQRLARELERAGVPHTAILRENRARHTLENARLTRLLLDAAGVTVHTALLCCQSFHARRCLKAYGRYFPEAKLIVCPAPTRGFDETNWHKKPVGVFKVCTELLKCTGLFFFLISFVRAR